MSAAHPGWSDATGPLLDVLIPTYERPAALAVTLAGVFAQTGLRFRVIVADQSERDPPYASGEVRAVVRALQARGTDVHLLRNLPRRGMAQQRQFLLDQVRAPACVFLDDDLVLEPGVFAQMLGVLQAEGCGFVGCGVHGLSFVDDERPHAQAVEFWDGPVQPERVAFDDPQWQRHHLHSAANLWHLQQRLARAGAFDAGPLRYRVAWVGACVMYDTAKLRDVGGFSFWRDLPEAHCGEDVLAQLRVMARYGGCGVLPSGVFHQELPTTVHDRSTDAPRVLPLEPAPPGRAAA